MSIHPFWNRKWRFFPRRSGSSASRDAEQTKWRWLLIALFPVGFLLTYTAHSDSAAYILLTFLATVACGLLVKRLRLPLHVTLPIWVILGIFVVGYYIKFYWMTWVLENNMEWPFDMLFFLPARSNTLMLRAYVATSLGFIAFCLTAWVALRWGGVWSMKPVPLSFDDSKQIRRRIIRFSPAFLGILGIIMLVTGYAQYITQVGIMGQDNIYLQFRMAGVIVHSRNIVIPTLLLLIVWLADMWQLRRLFYIVLGMLMLHGLTQMVLMSSRGILVNMILPVIFLWFTTDRFKGWRRGLTLGVIIFVLMAYPLFTSYRWLRLEDNPLDIFGALTQAFQDLENPLANLSLRFSSVISRVTGVDSLLFAVQWGKETLSLDTIQYYLFNPERTLPKIFTQDVAGFGPWMTSFQAAPSLLGTFYLMGGNTAVILGFVLWVALCELLWIRMMRLKWVTLPLIRAVFPTIILWTTMEGDLNILPRTVLIFGGSLCLCEFFVRKFVFPLSLFKQHPRVSPHSPRSMTEKALKKTWSS
jgi:hypothetical protein